MASDIQEYSVSINFTSKGSESTEKKVKSLQDKIDNLKKGNKKSLDFSSLGKGLASGLSNVSKLLSPLGKVMGAVVSYKTGEKISSMTKKMYDYIETINLFRASMGDAANQATEFINKAEDLLGLDPSQMMNAISSFYNLSQGFGIASDKAYLMSQNLTQLSGDLSSFANISFEAAQKKLMSGFSGQVLPLRQYGIALDQVSLQELAYSLGIEKRVKAMTRAEKTELIYYQIMKSTQKIQGDLGRSIIAPANAVRAMKTEFEKLARSVGSIFIPGMMAIIPVVRAVTRALTSAAKAIAEFFGFQMSDYEANLDSVGNLLDGVSSGVDDIGDSAEGTAKALNKMLMPFDELNNITSSAGSGGAGAGLDDLSGGTLGLDLPTYDMFESLDERFKDMIANGNWTKIAETWAKKINETLAKIPWEEIKEGASQLGSQLGEFMNLWVTNYDWELTGKTFAEGINTIFNYAYNYLKTINWKEWGESLSKSVNSLFENIDWVKVANTLSEGIKGIFDFVISFIDNLDIDMLEDKILTFLKNVDWTGIVARITYLIGQLILKGGELIANTIIKGINDIVGYDMLEEVDWAYGMKGYEEFAEEYFGISSDIKKAAQETTEAIEQSVSQAGDTLVTDTEEMSADTKAAFKELEEESFKFGKGFTNKFNTGLESESSQTEEAMEKKKRTVSGAFKELEESSFKFGKSTMSLFNTGLAGEHFNTEEIMANNKKTIEGSFKDVENNSFKSGKNITSWFNNGLESETSQTSEVLNRLRAHLQDGLNRPADAKNWGSNEISGYNSGMSSQENSVSSVVNTIKSKIESTLNNPNQSRKWGSDMITGLMQGIQDKTPAAQKAIESVAGILSKFIHFSRPDAGPLREYEQWMPDMMEGLSRTLVGSIPTLSSALMQVSETIAESIRDINIPDVSSNMFVNATSEQIIGQIGSNATRAIRETSTNYATETYEAIGRALAENAGNNRNQIIQVNVGNKRLYEGYGQYKEEQANMLGVNL